MSVLPVTVFFDFTCPFSYVTLAALQSRAAAGDVEIRARALERFPAPVPLSSPGEEDPTEPVRAAAGELGLQLRTPGFRPRSRKAHEAAAFAAERGRGAEMRSAIFAAYWAEGRDIGRIDVLSGLGADLGMDRDDLRIALDIDLHRDSVLHDEAVAERLRITRTPTVFLGTGPDATVIVGALDPEQLDRALVRHGV